MVRTNDDPPEYYSDEQYFRLIPTFRFPEELIYEVFLRLPVKSLIRFRCVSKGMLQLIDSPIFIKEHNILRSVISEGDREYAIVLFQAVSRRLFSVNFDKDDDNNLNLNRAKAIELNPTFAQVGKIEVKGWCCNGIFCFQYFEISQCYVFWNPSNGTFRKVDSLDRYACVSYFDSPSMGYDCVNDDYKIICFIEENKTRRSLEIYSFRRDSWRKIPIRYRDRDLDWDRELGFFSMSFCLGGVIHWLWTKRTDKSKFIAAFDLATETFTSLPLPLEAKQPQLQPCHFTDFRGRLCVTFSPAGYPRRCHGSLIIEFTGPQTIWVMENYGVGSSWSKLYTFDNTERRTRNLTNFYYPNMKRRLLCNFEGLSWWDPQDGSFEDIEIPGLLDDQAMYPQSNLAYVYVRNLLRLDHSPV